jgi:hypothetical protein
MLRGTPAWRRMKPERSRVRIIWWTDGGGDAEVVLHLPFGGRLTVHARIGIDEGQILALLGREAGFLSVRHLIHLSIHDLPLADAFAPCDRNIVSPTCPSVSFPELNRCVGSPP